jgi:alpha-L-fucosidase
MIPIRRRTLLAGAAAAAAGRNLQAADSAERAAWLKDARWGVMTHFLAEWIAPQAHESIETWNRFVEGFDTAGLANQLASAGAGYYLLTIGQNSGFYIAPNPTYDRLTRIEPSKCSRRDLVADMAAALKEKGIRLMVYLPSGAPGRDHAAIEALQWKRGHYPNHEFQIKWEAVIRDWSERWGARVSGWWIDGCYWPNAMYRSPERPNFASLAAALRAGNPNSILAFNHGVIYSLISITDEDDYTAGEANEPERITLRGSRFFEGRVDGAYPHMLSFLGEAWGKGAPRFSDEQVIQWTRNLVSSGAAVTWDAPIRAGGVIWDPFLRQLEAIGKAVGQQASKKDRV